MNNTLKTLAIFSSLVVSSYSHAFIKGADISWITQMEDSGYEFYNDWGYRQDALSILRDHGMNAVRLRVWVNPSDGYYSSLDDVIVKAQWAKDANMDVMIDFHYGDTWDEPQAKTIVSNMIQKVRSVNKSKGIGIFYWEPQAYNWQRYTLGMES